MPNGLIKSHPSSSSIQRIPTEMSDSCTQHGKLFPLPQRLSESTHSEGMLRNQRLSHLLMIFAIAQQDSLNNMWSAYMKEAGEYDKLMTDGWKEDAIGHLVFVSTNTCCAVIMLIILSVWYILCNRRDLPYWELHDIVSQCWRPAHTFTDLIATWHSGKWHISPATGLVTPSYHFHRLGQRTMAAKPCVQPHICLVYPIVAAVGTQIYRTAAYS